MKEMLATISRYRTLQETIEALGIEDKPVASQKDDKVEVPQKDEKFEAPIKDVKKEVKDGKPKNVST